MNTKEYISLANKNEAEVWRDSNSHEFTNFVLVWVKSRQPEVYRDLQASFKEIEGDVYAIREAESRGFNPSF